MSDDFYNRLPKRRMGAGVLFTNAAGDPLLVEPAYKDTWEIPGGIVEAGEDPRTCAVREVREELGRDIELGRLLVIDHRSAPPPRGDSTMLVYDGGSLDDPSDLRLPPDELLSARFIPPDDLELYVGEAFAHRVRQALRAKAHGSTIEIVNGTTVG